MPSLATHVDYSILPPPSELVPYVRFFWSLKSLPHNGDHYIFRTMANGYPMIFFSYEGSLQEANTNGYRGPSTQSGICGPTKITRRFRLTGDFGLFGACLYPFATQLFGVPATDIANEMISLHDLDADDIACTEDRMASGATNEQRADVMSGFLRSRIATYDTTKKITHAITGIIQSGGNIDIAAMAEEHCYSRRVFERKFKESTGFSPKSYSNVIRFQSSFDGLTAHGSSLTEIAYRYGYYDQSHFTNDFTRFSGFNPKLFTTNTPSEDKLWVDFVAFFQFLSWCPVVLCSRKG